MNHKKKIMLGVISLSALLAVGAFSGNNISKQQATRVDAETVTSFSKGDAIYVRINVGYFDDGYRCIANYQDSGSNWHNQEFTVSDRVTLLGGDQLYKVVLEAEAINFQVLRKTPDLSGQSDASTLASASGGVHNLYAVTGWNAGAFQGAGVAEITLKQTSNGTVSFVDRGNVYNVITDNHGYCYSDWNYTMTATPDSGYYFQKWQYFNGSAYTDFDSNGTVNPVNITSCEGDTRYQALFRSIEGDADAFVDTYMHFSDYAAGENGDGKCVSENWYDVAKDAYEALNTNVVNLLNNNAKYATTIARLEKWAIANGETFVDGVFSSGSEAKAISTISTRDNSILPITIAMGIGIGLSVVGFAIYKKRKLSERE